MSLGEGSAILILEPLSRAMARGCPIFAILDGTAMCSDAGAITKPDAAQVRRALSLALQSSGVAPDQVDYINAHGTGTSINDYTEASVISEVFGDHVPRLKVSSTKSQTGHTLGAAGALEAAATALAIKHQTIPPTANVIEPDPICKFDLVIGESRTSRIKRALSNSFAFGGLNAVLSFKRP
jgi:nodulation protein E